MPKSRTIKQQELLAVIGKDWLTRNQIAEALGKTELNASERKALEELVTTGEIRRKIQTVGIAEKFLYKKP